jgi:hypothetical protein
MLTAFNKHAWLGEYSRHDWRTGAVGVSSGVAIAILTLLAGACARAPVRAAWIEPDRAGSPVRRESLTSPESALRTIATVMADDLGIPLPGGLAAFVYPTWAGYAEGLVADGGMPVDRAGEIAAYSVGLGQAGRIFVSTETLRDVPRTVWLGILAHELTHVAQYELSGGRRGSSEQWLREGMADWVACQVLERLGESTFARERDDVLTAVALALPVLQGRPLDLIGLGRPLGWEARHLRFGTGPTYRLAFLLTDELIHRRGLPALLDYFRAFAGSDDRFGHFERAFGLSMREFEAEASIHVRAELGRIATNVPSLEEVPPDHPAR